MTIVVVMAGPPIAELAFPALDDAGLSPDERVRLYRAGLADVCRAVQSAGADLLVNHPPADRLPPFDDPAETLHTELVDLVANPDSIRYEVQVGDSWAGRVGNTVTHLLQGEDRDSVIVLGPRAAFLSREELGAAGMKLRSTGVVLGPDPDGGVYLAGFTDPIDFDGAYATPALETLTDRGKEASLDVDFLTMLPVIDTPTRLAGAVTQLRARRIAGRRVPAGIAAIVEDLGLAPTSVDGHLRISRSDNP